MILSSQQIKNIIIDYFKDKPVKRVWLFGSYARDEANEKSDVDVLIELDYNKNPGIEFFGWNDELTEQVQKKVDVVSKGGLSKYIRPYIEKDKQLIYAK